MDLRSQIINKLSEKGFPDFDFFSSEKTLKAAPETLEYLLKEEKEKFEALLQKDNKNLSFDDLQEESLLDYFWSIINHFENTDSNTLLRKIIEDFMPKLQDFANEVAYSKEYFNKLVFLRENANLDSEQIRILDISIKAYRDRGIDLEEKKQEKIKHINKKLGELSEIFGNNIVDAKKEFEYIIDDFEKIKELPKDVLEKTKKAYREKYTNDKNAYLFDADPTSTGAIMQYCSDAQIRKDFEKAGYTTATYGKYDNRKVVLEILQLKEKKASILGFKNFAELSLNTKMAQSPKQVFDLIEGILQKAKSKALREIQELKDYFSLEQLESYDVAYYSRKYKEEKYNLDDKEVKKYFEYEMVLQYLFDIVEKFYGIEIREIKEKVSKGNIKVYEIYREEKLISYYFLDAFYRPGKRLGAWADDMRSKEYLPEPKVPVVLNVCNFLENEHGKTTLYKRDVETIFHEFGHAIHVMLSESKYSALSGFHVEWDFVELPSQLMENWVGTKESLVKLAKHVDTGEKLPAELLQKFEDLKTYMTGNFAVRQNELALLDMTLHSEKAPETIEELDKKSLDIVNKYGIRKREADYKMYASFGHIFGGGYAAGYYSYMWAEILEADVFERIKHMGMFDTKTGKKLLDTIIGQGARKDANELFFDFMGREVDNEAFMKRYGI